VLWLNYVCLSGSFTVRGMAGWDAESPFLVSTQPLRTVPDSSVRGHEVPTRFRMPNYSQLGSSGRLQGA